MGSWGQVSTALPWVPSTSSLLPAPAPAFHSSSRPSKGVSSLFQQPPGHCIPSSNPNKCVGVWWVFFLTGRPRTSECGFWFQVFPTFWPTLLSPTAPGSPASLQLSRFAKPWLWLGNRRLHAALLGCHPLWVPWISQQECFKKAKPSFFHQRGKIHTQHFHGCAQVKTPQASCVFGPRAQNVHQIGLQRWTHSAFQFLRVYHRDGRGECHVDSDAGVVFDQQSSPTSMGIKLT